MRVSQARPIIVCPLRYEMRALQRAGLGDVCDLVCCGPGAARIVECVNSVDRDRPVVLAGLAGALIENISAGCAFIIDEVIDAQSSQRWSPTLHLHPSGDQRMNRCIITSVNSSVVDRAEKIALHQRCGATLVDHESVAFAQTASRRDMRWAIVRGISDDLNTKLPADVDEWVDERGCTRIAAVLKSLTLRPGTLAALPRLQSNSRRAMLSLAKLLQCGLAPSHPSGG